MKKLPQKINSSGFTLVELLVVVAIIAVLSVVGLAVFSNIQTRGRDARRTADLDSMSKAMEVNYKNGAYATLATTMFASGAIPTDPKGDGTYIVSQSGTDYKFCADMELKADGTADSWNGDVSVAVGQNKCVSAQQK